jgi:hypothetical protein
MANEFVARNGIIAKANSTITGTLDVSGNITMGTALVATRTWVTGTALAGYATQSYVTTAINNLIDAAPGTLDTLNELAAALGDDPNFVTTVTNSIATKLSLAGGTMTGNINWGTTDRGLTWEMNTDGAYIKFFNTGDGDTNSRLEYATSDNGDEYHRFLVAGIERMAITFGKLLSQYKLDLDEAFVTRLFMGSFLSFLYLPIKDEFMIQSFVNELSQLILERK